MTTRRRFLRDSYFLAAATLLVPSAGLTGPLRRATSLDQVRFEAFAANVGTVFWVLQDEGPAIGLELAEAQARPPANALDAAAPDAWNERFSLLFRGLPDQPLSQDTYVFQHDALGWFAMFIVPVVSWHTDYRVYQAIFNRPLPMARPQGTREGRVDGAVLER